MKYFAFILSALMTLPLLFGGEEVKVTVDKSWTGSLEKGFTLDYKGKYHPRIATLWTVKKDTFYRIRLEYSSSEAARLGCRIMLGKRKALPKLECGKQPVTLNIPVYTGESGTLSLDFFKSPSDPVKLSLKIVSVKEMTPEELLGDQFDDVGSFEKSAPVFSPRERGNVVPCGKFAAGEKALELTGSVTSFPLALIPGKKYELRFFACAESKASLNATVQLWSPFGHKGKHFYRNEFFALTAQPTLCRVEIVIPEPSAVPDAADRLGSVVLRPGKKDSKIWIDELIFREIK